jgi:hypothetical protein
MTANDERIRNYVAGLPDASGTFTGTFDPDAAAELLGPVPDLLPIEIDTGGQPNPAAGFASTLTIRSGGDEWNLPVDHVEQISGNQVRVWVRRPA